MQTFLTPDPITLEIRNASGNIQIVLTDTTTTTVDVSASTSHPLGFLDDVFSAIGVGRSSSGRPAGGWAGRLESLGRGRPFGGGLFGEQHANDQPAEDGPTGPATDRSGAAPTRDDLVESVRVEHRDTDKPSVLIDTDSARDGWRSSFDIIVTAPNGSNIRILSQSSDVTVSGPAGIVDVRSASGDVQLDETSGKTLVQTASGKIRLAAAGSEVDFRTASGDVEVGPVGGDALVHTTSGSIKVGAVAGNISARSVSGDVRVADATSGSAEVNAVSGDVEIGVHAGSLASINLSTVSGSTDTDFAVAGEAPEGDAPVLEITVKTTSGDIRLRRAA